MTQQKLDEILGTISRLIEQARPEERDGTCLLDEIETYLNHDPLLSGLHRDYLDARAVCARLLRDSGADDPMTEIAVDRLESCLGAFETRLIELRRDFAARNDAVRRLKKLRAAMELQDEENRRADLRYRKEAQSFYDRRDFVARGRDSYGLFLLSCAMLRQTAASAHESLRVANAFLAAAGDVRDWKIAG